MLELNRSVPSSVPNVQPPVTTQQKRALRRLLRDLVAAVNDLPATPTKASSLRKCPRLLYRRADTLTDDEVKSIVAEIGVERIWRIVDKLTAPELPLVAAE